MSDAVLDMAPVSLDGLKNPGLALGIVEKAGQLGAVLTMAGKGARAAPVGGRRQGFGDSRAQMRNTSRPCENALLGSDPQIAGDQGS
jgi:hypothetical protein